MKNLIYLGIQYLSGAFLLWLCFAGVAWADEDRDATPDERAKVEEVLKKQSCPSFDDVDFIFRSNLYKVNDVICNDGKKYDILLDKNFNIVSKQEDRD
ncbi:hypothetical protein [Nostoc sp. LPT]|uniref:hypothetical protein n=1 Tax=Nostoc sp. LPT TaxID=2815387 RepID=UPI001DF4991F|nr:hypothetical protein [Nostoc sp. LPT]MBN4006895.1 PepSY domain-containing protein [Nostoc sp. LPT]